MKFIPIGKISNTLQGNLRLSITRQAMNLTYTEILKGSNYGHKAIK